MGSSDKVRELMKFCIAFAELADRLDEKERVEKIKRELADLVWVEEKNDEKRRVEIERVMRERVEKWQVERKQRAEREQAERERVKRKQAEAEQAERERPERERAEKERAERERVEAEQEKKRKEVEERRRKEIARLSRAGMETIAPLSIIAPKSLKMLRPDAVGEPQVVVPETVSHHFMKMWLRIACHFNQVATVEWLAKKYGCTRNDYNRTRNYILRRSKIAVRLGRPWWTGKDSDYKDRVPSSLAWLDDYTSRSNVAARASEEKARAQSE